MGFHSHAIDRNPLGLEGSDRVDHVLRTVRNTAFIAPIVHAQNSVGICSPRRLKGDTHVIRSIGISADVGPQNAVGVEFVVPSHELIGDVPPLHHSGIFVTVMPHHGPDVIDEDGLELLTGEFCVGTGWSVLEPV